MVGKICHPAADQAGRHRLRADVHQPPLVQLVVLQLQFTAVQRIQQVLGPGHEKPDDGALLLAHRLQNGARRGPLEQHAPAALQKRAQPVHLGAGVVERRNTQKDILVLGVMVVLFHLGRMNQAGVPV